MTFSGLLESDWLVIRISAAQSKVSYRGCLQNALRKGSGLELKG